MKKAQDVMGNASQSVTTAQQWTYGSIIEGLRFVVAENRKLDDQGTPLRGIFRSCRLAMNDVIEMSYGTFVDAKAFTETHVTEIQRRTAFLADAAKKVDDTRKNKPEILVGSLTAAAVGLSLFASRRRIIINGLSAFVVSSTAVYGSIWYHHKFFPPPPPEKTHD